MTVYTDILFFTNFIMDYLIISVCSAIVPPKTKHIRKISASLLGGLYGVFIFIPELKFIYSVLSVFLFSAGIVAIVFLPCKPKEYFRYLSVYYITSFIFAGCLYMILPFIGGGMIRNNVIYFDSINILLISLTLWFTIKKGIKYIKKHRKKEELLIKIKYKNYHTEVKGILDTGNLLTDPVSGKTVAVGDEDILKKLFSPDCNLFNLNEWIDSTDIRIIPYKTVDTEGVMTGFIADEITSDNQVFTKMVIAISPLKLNDGILINCFNT